MADSSLTSARLISPAVQQAAHLTIDALSVDEMIDGLLPLTYTITGLSPETEYAFTVSASNAVGTTPSGTVLRTTRPGGVPTPSTVAELDGFVPQVPPVVTFSMTVNGIAVTEFLGREGDWVYAYVHSDPIGLGWQQVGTSGVLSWDTSSLNLAPGVHRLAILDSNGVLIGVHEFTVEGSALTDGTTGGTVGAASLPVTGGTFAEAAAILYVSTIALALGMMFVVEASVVNRRVHEVAGIKELP